MIKWLKESIGTERPIESCHKKEMLLGFNVTHGADLYISILKLLNSDIKQTHNVHMYLTLEHECDYNTHLLFLSVIYS